MNTVFNSQNQSTAERLEDYVAALHTLSKTCNFCECMRDSLMRDCIVLGITDNATRKRLLQESGLNLTTCIDICRCAEPTSSQLRSIGCEEMSAHAITSHSSGGKLKPKCKFCGKTHHFKKSLCPAWGKMCKMCKKKNHFAEKCPMKRECKNIHLLENIQINSDSEQLLSVTDRQQKIIKANMLINEKPVKFQIDCGASVNVIPEKYNIKDTSTLISCKTSLHMWNKTILQPKKGRQE
ncbi:uncharacterized protein LOC121391203 [Gigantopelta aegis]|uniref:uncharacterized protein LOC121391203 n=1 Tax=Gigantopelta aegis TaxID=1735272 RepID=UPI001B889005|nr:uncharacterized protein LOC121391203 [Gigantopelta aegis]